MGTYRLGDAMRKYIGQSRLKNGLRTMQLKELWEEVMGKVIARHTEKIELKGHTLYISSPVGALKNELIYQRSRIIERLNEAMGEVVIREVIIQ